MNKNFNPNPNVKLTLSNLPMQLPKDKFYCYDIKKGNIYIGNIIGKSAKNAYYTYVSINDHTFKFGWRFPEETNCVSVEKLYKCFINRDDFVKDYQKTMATKIKPSTKTRYFVDRDTFFCVKTRSMKPYFPNHKEFPTQQEATEFSEKGLSKLQMTIEKLYEESKQLNEEIKKVKKFWNPGTNKQLYQLQTNPRNCKVGDKLFEMTYKYNKEQTTHLFEINPDKHLEVEDFITPTMIKLNDGTLLEDKDCNSYSFPLFFKEEDRKDIFKNMVYSNLSYLESDLSSNIRQLENLVKYSKTYTPFKKGVFAQYFGKKYITGDIQLAKQYLDKVTVMKA